jgi:hypothetical protein
MLLGRAGLARKGIKMAAIEVGTRGILREH